jgi:hypothetical protein
MALRDIWLHDRDAGTKTTLPAEARFSQKASLAEMFGSRTTGTRLRRLAGVGQIGQRWLISTPRHFLFSQHRQRLPGSTYNAPPSSHEAARARRL